ncbi:MAG: transposase [bacterium]
MAETEKKKPSIGTYLLATLLSMLDLEFLREHLKKFYAEEWRWKKFDCISVLKLDIFRIFRQDDFTGVIRYLAANPKEAALLGFSELPSEKTVWHWEKVRIGGNGWKHLFLVCVRKIRFLLVPIGIILGKHLGQDSTPIASTREDPDAKFNPHYKLKMHKGHLLLDVEHNLPLNYDGSDGLAYDGDYLLPLIDESEKNLETVAEDCVADGHYGSFENHAHMHMRGCGLIVKPSDSDVYHPEADEEGLKAEYQKLRGADGWLPPNLISLRQLLEFLYLHGKVELVGMHFRNALVKIKDAIDFLEHYHRRSVNEGFHGVVKDNTGFGKMRVSGSRNLDVHLGVHLLSVLAVGALFKIQNGVTTELMGLGHVIV